VGQFSTAVDNAHHTRRRPQKNTLPLKKNHSSAPNLRAFSIAFVQSKWLCKRPQNSAHQAFARGMTFCTLCKFLQDFANHQHRVAKSDAG
jgi:hypothetical protein